MSNWLYSICTILWLIMTSARFQIPCQQSKVHQQASFVLHIQTEHDRNWTLNVLLRILI